MKRWNRRRSSIGYIGFGFVELLAQLDAFVAQRLQAIEAVQVEFVAKARVSRGPLEVVRGLEMTRESRPLAIHFGAYVAHV